MALFYEDVPVGTEWTSDGRTIDQSDIQSFAGLSGDFNQLHVNEEWVRENTGFRGRIAHGLLILAISNGLRCRDLDDLQVLAFLDVHRRMTRPAYPGDTIYHRTQVVSGRESKSRPDAGVLELSVQVYNQDGEVIQAGTDVLMVQRRNQDDRR